MEEPVNLDDYLKQLGNKQYEYKITPQENAPKLCDTRCYLPRETKPRSRHVKNAYLQNYPNF